MTRLSMFLIFLPLTMLLSACDAETGPIRVLIVDGQNNHKVWPKSTMMMKQYLEETGKFTVDIQRTRFTWRGEKWSEQYPLDDGLEYFPLPEPKTDPHYLPAFDDYDVVISNFGWKAAPWPDETQATLEAFVSAGGGFVVVHAANNSWPEWKAFNRMIGLGGWGGRNEKDGPYVYYNEAGELVRDTSPGHGGSHGPQHEILITLREPHPITDGMPQQWLHTQDECYDRLRGPAEKMTIIASAYSSPELKGTGRHEPMLMVLEYGEGRIFHTTLGHEDYSFEGVGFQTTLLRGVEWVATGKVTLPIPDDFPTTEEATSRPFKQVQLAENE
ncbi:MAG: ThuA domain-containing protein [Puniceicoccaceae bacterium]